MKRLTLLCSIALAAIPLHGQITLGKANFAGLSDTLRYSLPTIDQTIDYSSTGANATWDFSHLAPLSQELDQKQAVSNQNPLVMLNFGALASTAYKANYHVKAAEFPLNNVPQLPISEARQYHKLDDQALNIVGYALVVQENQVPVKSTIIEKIYQFPLHFGDSIYSTGHTATSFNPIYDGEWRQHRTRTSVVDGWGDITTPFGQFSALRIHNKIEEIDSFYVSVITNFNMWIPLPKLTYHEYIWQSNTDKGAILYIKTSELLGAQLVTEIKYRDHYIGLAGLDQQAAQASLSVFPNPVSGDYLQLTGEATFDDYQIYSLDGQILQSKTDSTYVIPVSALTPGTYLIKVVRGSTSEVFRFVKL